MRFLPRFIWRQAGGLPECPYFHRTILDFGFFSIRIHEWHSDDDHRAYHDHPYWFWTFVLKGGYTDVAPSSNGIEEVYDMLRAPAVRYRAAEYKHSVQNVIPGTITILLTGKPFRRWGFWVNGKLIKRDKYFATKGHHPCDPSKDGVRIKPDGSRI